MVEMRSKFVKYIYDI